MNDSDNPRTNIADTTYTYTVFGSYVVDRWCIDSCPHRWWTIAEVKARAIMYFYLILYGLGVNGFMLLPWVKPTVKEFFSDDVSDEEDPSRPDCYKVLRKGILNLFMTPVLIMTACLAVYVKLSQVSMVLTREVTNWTWEDVVTFAAFVVNLVNLQPLDGNGPIYDILFSGNTTKPEKVCRCVLLRILLIRVTLLYRDSFVAALFDAFNCVRVFLVLVSLA